MFLKASLVLTSFTDTVLGSGKTPDYLLLGNMVYTVSASVFLTQSFLSCDDNKHHIHFVVFVFVFYH